MMPLHESGIPVALDVLFGGHQSRPDPLWVALTFTAPAFDAEGAQLDEPESGDYERVQVDNDTSSWEETLEGEKTNAEPVVFPTATGPWGSEPLRFFVLVTASSGGDVLASGSLLTARRVFENMTPRFDPGDLIVTAR